MISAADILKKNKDYTLFSWSVQSQVNPLNIKSAKACYLHDHSGKNYLDFSSQLMNVNIGHGRQEVTEAVARQMQDFCYVAPSMATRARGELGEKLAAISPKGLNKTFFTLGGAEAIENAIKLARYVTGRHKIITHYRSYHGATMGAISAGGDPRKLPVDANQNPHIVHVENPYFYRCPWYSTTEEECGERAVSNMEKIILYEGAENIAAILLEGESGTSGCIKYPPFYWKKVAALAKKYNILTISDEVMSGFARTGKWFGIDHHDVSPDMMCMAKGITAGYLPLGGLMVSDDIFEQIKDRYLPLGLTYSAHTVSCAAALAVIDIYEKENLVHRAAEMGAYLDQRMEELKTLHPSFGDWRNTGMLGAIELVKNKTTKEPMAPFNAKANELGPMKTVAKKIRELGMFTFVKWNYIFVAPPLVISKLDIDKGIEILSKAISAGEREL